MALIDNLAAYWKMDGNSNGSLGTNNGSDTNVTYSTANGIINQGAGYNGTSSRTTFSAPIIPLGAKSICFWIKPTSHAAFKAVIDNNQLSSANNGTCIFYTSGGGATLQFFSGNGSGSTNRFSLTTPTVSDGVWSHVALTWDGTTSANTVKAYVNGGTPTTATASSTETTQAPVNLAIASLSGGGANFFNGALDEIGIWSRELSAAEITQLYNGGVGLSYPFGTNNFFQSW